MNFNIELKILKVKVFKKEKISSCMPFQQDPITREWLCLGPRCTLTTIFSTSESREH